MRYENAESTENKIREEGAKASRTKWKYKIIQQIKDWAHAACGNLPSVKAN